MSGKPKKRGGKGPGGGKGPSGGKRTGGGQGKPRRPSSAAKRSPKAEAASRRPRSGARAEPELTRNGQPALPRDVWKDESPGAPVVGVLRHRGKFLVAEPLFDRGSRVVVDRAGRDVHEGRIALLVPGKRGRKPKGHRVLRDLGRPDVARDVIEALLLHRGLPRRTARSVGIEAEGVAAGPAGEDQIHRRDLREQATFTIDPATARDFDDAISAEQIGDDPAHCRIGIHIADVSAYVRPGGAIDGDARWRGTSVYVPGTVEPMLPPSLSNDACSLVPGVDRLAVTVEIEFQAAKVVRVEVTRSVIRSDARLDYDQVDRIFAGSERAEDPWAQPLTVARRVAQALHDQRQATTTALELDTGEPQFRFDSDGHVDGIAVERATEAHRLIEHLMIAANEQVARLLAEANVPTLHRVHGLPAPASVERLHAQLQSLGVVVDPLPEGLTREQAAAAVAELSRRVDQHVRRTGHGRVGLSSLVLRALQQARYEPKSQGHAGLGLSHYCHFTSPIRRYPDLIAHRAVLSLVGAGEAAPAGSSSRLEELGIWCSATEREAMSIERTADQIGRAFLLQRMLFQDGWDQRFDGEVVGLASAGAFVRFGGGGSEAEAFEGLVPVRRLSGDWWELDELGTMLVGSRTGEVVRIGDPLTVTVDGVEPERGRVSLVPVTT